jgi:hypothetical protein
MTIDQWIGIVSALASVAAVVLALTRPIEISPRAIVRSIETLVIYAAGFFCLGYLLLSTLRTGDLFSPHGILINPDFPPVLRKISYFAMLFAIVQGLAMFFVLTIISVVRGIHRCRKWINEVE